MKLKLNVYQLVPKTYIDWPWSCSFNASMENRFCIWPTSKPQSLHLLKPINGSWLGLKNHKLASRAYFIGLRQGCITVAHPLTFD